LSQFVVSARKYRPTRFDEMVGQSHVSTTLKNAIKSGHIAHAYLFTGPRGVGKTSCARILAKVLNCENPTKELDPCNTCGSCKAFQDNASFNILELDAASNNGVEHIRNLIEQVRFQPQNGKYKVFIIDEVHMLSTSSFNAFLKTLEEPPPYAIFILATTEKHKILPTILSRCQIYDFRKIRTQDIFLHLKDISGKENLKAEEDALHMIASKSDGGLRDALSIFDRIVSFSNGEITYNGVITNLNILDYDHYFKTVEALMLEDLPSVMQILDEIIRAGFEEDLFILGLASHMRDLLMAKHPNTLEILEITDSLKNRYLNQAKATSKSFLVSALDLLNECDIQFKTARNKRLHVEICLIRLVYFLRQENPNPEIQKEKDTVVTRGKLSAAPSATKKITIPVSPAPKTNNPENNASENLQFKIPSQLTKVEDREENYISDSIIPSSAPQNRLFERIDLNKIESKIQLEDEKSRTKKELEFELVVTLWQEYAEKIESPSAKHSIKNATLELIPEKKLLIATVPSVLAKNFVNHETGLIQNIRDTFGAPDLILEIRISEDASQNISNVAKPLNPKEKYQYMVEKNPMLEELRIKFQLKFEGE
jgi:DNA polymerase III subunit gamma/tau